jgi:hypothetical protein
MISENLRRGELKSAVLSLLISSLNLLKKLFLKQEAKQLPFNKNK